MGFTLVALKEKILEIYPELMAHGVIVGLLYSEEIDAYVVTLRKGERTLATHLELGEAADCMNNRKCLSLAAQIEQLIKNIGNGAAAYPETDVVSVGASLAKVDADGYLINYYDWNDEIATALAEKAGIAGLTKEHMDILRFIRSHYEQYNYFPIVRAVCRTLHQTRDCMTEKFLTPAMAWKIAGLPHADAVLENLLEHNEPPT